MDSELHLLLLNDVITYCNFRNETGAILGTFDDNRFKSEAKKPALKSIDIIGLGSGPGIEKKLKYAEDVCSGIILGKELVNAPANVLTPGLLIHCFI